MQKLILFFLFILSFSAISSDKFKRENITSILPKELSSLSNEDQKTLVQKFKSKLSSKDQNSLFLNYHSANDVTIGLKNDKFKYLLIDATEEMQNKTRGLFGQIYSQLSAEDKAKITEELSAPTHTAGRKISIDLPSEGLKLEFNNNEKKTLSSVILWPVGGEHP